MEHDVGDGRLAERGVTQRPITFPSPDHDAAEVEELTIELEAEGHALGGLAQAGVDRGACDDHPGGVR